MSKLYSQDSSRIIKEGWFCLLDYEIDSCELNMDQKVRISHILEPLKENPNNMYKINISLLSSDMENLETIIGRLRKIIEVVQFYTTNVDKDLSFELTFKSKDYSNELYEHFSKNGNRVIGASISLTEAGSLY